MNVKKPLYELNYEREVLNLFVSTWNALCGIGQETFDKMCPKSLLAPFEILKSEAGELLNQILCPFDKEVFFILIQAFLWNVGQILNVVSDLLH